LLSIKTLKIFVNDIFVKFLFLFLKPKVCMFFLYKFVIILMIVFNNPKPDFIFNGNLKKNAK